MRGLFKFIHEGVYKGEAESATKPNSAPYLIPPDAKGAFQNADRENISVVNVVKDFPWTMTRQQGRKEVPTIELSEYYVNFSTLLNQIRYVFSSLSDTRDAVANFLKQVNLNDTSEFGRIVAGAANAGAFITGDVGFDRQTIVDEAIKNTNALINSVDGVTTFNEEVLLEQHLRPYYGLYSTTPTGFRYKLPYYTPDWKVTNSSWGTSNGQFLGGPSGFLDKVGDVLSPGGTYIERSKQIDYGEDAPEWTIGFNLYNNTTFDDVINNWHFVFMMIYQNLVNRTSKVLIEPPVIYEVNVPGVLYTPFAYISYLDIKNMGATRSVDIPASFSEPITDQDTLNSAEVIQAGNRADVSELDIKETRNHTKPQADWLRRVPETNISDIGVENMFNNTKVIKTVVPEAYQVTMKIKSLLPETRNLMYTTINPDRTVYDVNIAIGGSRTDALNAAIEQVIK